MRIAVLGPLEVRANDAAPVDVPGARQRLLLGVLAAGAPGPVAEQRLIDSLRSADTLPVDVETLRAEVRALRTSLEPGLPGRSSGQYVLHRGSGYALALARGDVDAVRFTDLAARGRARLAAGDADDAVRLLVTALGLWAGEPYCDWPDADFAEAERRRLEGIRAEAESDLAQARQLLAQRPTPSRTAEPVRPWLTGGPGVGLPEVAHPAHVSSVPARPPQGDTVDPGGAPTRNTHRTALLIGALVAAIALPLVVARQSGDRPEPAEASSTVADADRLASLSVTERPLDVALLLAAQAFRIADTATTRSALTGALDGHGRVERAASFVGFPRHPVLSGGGTLTFAVGTSVVGWTAGPTTVPRVLMSVPGSWGAWTVAAPSPVEDVVMAAGVAGGGPWLRMVSVLDGSSRLLLEGEEVGGRPLDGAISAGGRVLLVVVEPDPAAPDDASRWRLLDVDAVDGTRRDTGVGGTVRAPADGVRADVADDAGSFVVWDAAGSFPAVLVRAADGQQTPILMPARPGRSRGFRAFPGGAVELWDDGLFAVVDRAGNTIQAINVHQHPVQDVAVSPDGRWAVTAGAGDEVYRWDVDPVSGRWYGPGLLSGHTDDVVGVAVAAAGRRLVSVSLDHTAIVWDMRTASVVPRPGDPGSRLAAACAIVGRDLTPDEWRRFLPDRPWQPTCSDLR